MNTFGFLRSLVSANFWNILFPYSKTLSNPTLILDQASTPVVVTLAGPLSTGFALFDFNVSYRAQTSNSCFFFLHYLPASYGWRIFLCLLYHAL